MTVQEGNWNFILGSWEPAPEFAFSGRQRGIFHSSTPEIPRLDFKDSVHRGLLVPKIQRMSLPRSKVAGAGSGIWNLEPAVLLCTTRLDPGSPGRDLESGIWNQLFYIVLGSIQGRRGGIWNLESGTSGFTFY